MEILRASSTVGLLLDEDSRLHLYIDGLDQGVAASDIPSCVYAVVDLYGKCEQISISGSTLNSIETLNNELLNNMQNMATAIENEDFENSREKADLECHEKESHVMVTIEGDINSSKPEEQTKVEKKVKGDKSSDLNERDVDAASCNSDNSEFNSNYFLISIYIYL